VRLLSSCVFEGMRPDGLPGVESGPDVGRCRIRIAGRREVGSVVTEDRVDPIADSLDQAAQKVRSRAAGLCLRQSSTSRDSNSGIFTSPPCSRLRASTSNRSRRPHRVHSMLRTDWRMSDRVMQSRWPRGGG
jgi:hypothetical protein